MGRWSRPGRWVAVGVVAALLVAAVVLRAPQLRSIFSGGWGFGECPPAPVGEGAPFDPLVRPATIGYFPEPMSHRFTQTGPDLYEVGYTWRDIGMSRLPVATELDLRLWRAGADPWLTDGPPPVPHERVDPVTGGEAFWLPVARLLRWELRPRMWAELGLRQTLINGDVPTPFPQPPLTLVRRVAESVTLTPEPLRLPWRLPEAPDGFTPTTAQIAEDPQQGQLWSAEVVFGRDGRACPAGLIISSESLPGPGPTDGHAIDLTIKLATDDHGTTLTATGNTARHILLAPSPGPGDRLGPDGVRSFFDRMEIYGEPSTWQGGTLTGR